MRVTAIERCGKYKYKVFLDEVYAFWLSWKELKFLETKRRNRYLRGTISKNKERIYFGKV